MIGIKYRQGSVSDLRTYNLRFLLLIFTKKFCKELYHCNDLTRAFAHSLKQYVNKHYSIDKINSFTTASW